MYPNEIFGFLHLYGVMIAVGILACFGFLFYYGKKKKIQPKFIDFVFYNGIVAIIVGFGSAALFQATYNYIDDPSAGFNFKGGITFIGGLIGGIVSFLVGYWIFRKKYESKITELVPFAPCCILIAHAFGRVGCFFAGCCYGKPTDSWLGVKFPDLGYKVYPTQLYEAIFLFALCAICWLLYWKKDFKHNLSLYLIAYGIFRFCIEYLRDDPRGQFIIKGITPSQFWSICMVVAGVGVYFLMRWLYKRRDRELAAIAEKEALQTSESEEEQTEAQV